MKKMWLGFRFFSAPALRGGASLFATLLVASTAMAQEAGSNAQDVGKFAALAAGLAIGIAAAGCGLGQGRAGAAALDGIARNPNASDKLFTPMILVLALIESLAIYALVIAIMLLGKIPS
jgi:F-type H+-transporting ATPase subunit c